MSLEGPGLNVTLLLAPVYGTLLLDEVKCVCVCVCVGVCVCVCVCKTVTCDTTTVLFTGFTLTVDLNQFL